MSIVSRELYRRKLNNYLSLADDEAFFVMTWATHAIQTGRENYVGNLLTYPPEAASSNLSSPYATLPWRLETLLNEILATTKLQIRANANNRRLNCRVFAAMAGACNILNKLENAEDGIVLRRVNVLREIHRLGQRQFEWQRGFLSIQNLCRAGIIYGGPMAKDYSEKTYQF